ncbi:ABC transporter substrate-binding protein [Oceanisphaera arctica]|uniref:Nitrate ABC transporter substrate-binding protein n=1 Tax=Oceanisphaera arctica TaxID=641510 RepID=A0A2P5TPT6_9GAMM|nr:ABC transporter substrate-binding protein [Oceanisphaera arctica]PPL17716.1 nitrate ABC transporter substrate-binding protein [Oceanisphaera arctica]GHA18462.1 putative thiamine biosynthesis protein [Oceanisphaera arctica]
MIKTISKLSTLALLSLALVACGDDINSAKKEGAEKLRVASWSQPITEQTNILAENKDFFSKQNMEIKFIPGAGGGDAIKNIASGKADIAFTDPGSLFSALDKGEKLIALYDIYPRNVFNVVSLKESNITKPEDLKGKKIGVYSLSSGTRQNLLVLLNKAGLTEDDVEIIETGVLNFAPLMQGQVDATAATDTGLATGKAKGLGDVEVMEVKDYFNYSSDLFVVTEKTYEQKKDELYAFLEGYKASVKWMMENTEEAAKLAVKYAIDGKNEAHNVKIIELRNASSLPLSNDVAELGLMSLSNLQNAADMYYELGIISQKLNLTPVVNKKYMLTK